jgi:hypothetical protein
LQAEEKKNGRKNKARSRPDPCSIIGSRRCSMPRELVFSVSLILAPGAMVGPDGLTTTTHSFEFGQAA